MSSPVLEKLRTERDQVRTAARAIAEGDEFDPEKDDNYKELEARATKLDDRIKTLGELMQKQAAADAFDGQMAKAAKAREEQQQRNARQPAHSRGSWGSRFIESENFREYRGRGQSPIFNADIGPETRALPTGLEDLIAAGLTAGKERVDVTPPPIPTPLLNAVSTVTVAANAIEYVSWSVKEGGADVVPEKEVKPSIEYEPKVVPDTLDTIAVYTQLTRQLLEDAGAVRSMIDSDLRRQVLIKEEAEAAAAIAAADLTPATGSSLLAAIRVGIADVQANGYNPNAVLLNPADYADMDLEVMGATVNGPTIGQRFWGLTPIPSAAQTEGQAVVGDFLTAVNHFVRSEVALYITDSHASTFLSNVFTLLAERRSKTAVVRPAALALATAGTGS